jgi:hypothetical protein
MRHLRRFNESKGEIEFKPVYSDNDTWSLKYNTKDPKKLLNKIDDFSFFSQEYTIWKDIKSGKEDITIEDAYSSWDKVYVDKIFKIFDYLNDNEKIDEEKLLSMFKSLDIDYKISLK